MEVMDVSSGLFPTSLEVSSEPYVVVDPLEIEFFPPYPFPLIGEKVSENWDYISQHRILLELPYGISIDPSDLTTTTAAQYADYLSTLIGSGNTYGFLTVYDCRTNPKEVVIATFRRTGNMPAKRKKPSKKGVTATRKTRKVIENNEPPKRACLRCREPFVPANWKANWICPGCTRINEKIRDVACRRASLPSSSEDDFD